MAATKETMKTVSIVPKTQERGRVDRREGVRAIPHDSSFGERHDLIPFGEDGRPTLRTVNGEGEFAAIRQYLREMNYLAASSEVSFQESSLTRFILKASLRLRGRSDSRSFEVLCSQIN